MVGVSFKIAKTGTRYCPRSGSTKPVSGNGDAVSLPQNSKTEAPFQTEMDSVGAKRKRGEVALAKISGDVLALSLSSTSSEGHPITSEHEVSFSVNLFLDGFSIGKATEKGKSPPSAQEFTESLHPYDRTSETLFQAIDGGWLPGDILEDIPCKYFDGSIICEVRDYRKDLPLLGDSVSSGEGFPVVQKVLLRPSMENIVKDISSMAEESWTYSDLMEIESRILKAVQPKLCLDPIPMLERLCENHDSKKLNLGVLMTRRQRMQGGGLASIKVMSNNLSHRKKVSIERPTEKAKCQSGIASISATLVDSSASCLQESPTVPVVSSSIPDMRSKMRSNVESGQDLARYGVPGSPQLLPSQTGLNRARLVHAQANQSTMPPSLVGPMSYSSNSVQDATNTYMDARSGVPILGKRDSRDVSTTTTKPDVKKPKQEQSCLDKFQQQNTGPKIETKLSKDQQRKDKPMQKHQNNEIMHFSDVTAQRHPQPPMADDDQQIAVGEVSQHESKFSSHLDQRSTGEFKVKEEQLDFDRGQNAVEQEKQETERNKEDPHVMELGNDQSDQQQLSSSQCLPQQQFGKSPLLSSQQWQNLGQLGEKDHKKDELLQKKKLGQSPRVLQKPEVRGLVQSPALSKSGELSQPLTPPAVPCASLGTSFNNMPASVPLGQQKEKSLGLTAMSTSTTSVNSSQIDSLLHPQVQSSMSFGRRRSNSLPKTPTVSGVASPGSVTNTVAPSNVNSPSTGTAPMPNLGAKTDPSVVVQGQNKQLETVSSLVSVVQRHGLPTRKKNVEEIPEVKKASPSWQLLLIALAPAANNEDQKDINGQRSMANSLVGGGVNVRKTRILNFVRADHFFQGQNLPILVHRNRVRLVMCERGKDGMVEAVVQFGDDQDDESLNSFPHDVLPTLPNTHFADRFATQFCALMAKDKYELTDDQVQPITTRPNLPPNAASSAHPMTPGASTLSNNINQLPSPPCVMGSQNMPGTAAVCGIPQNSMPLSSPNALAAVRMPPPGNAPTRQLSAGYLQSGMVTSSKPLQLDPTSQLTVVQQQQQQQQQQHQLQQHQQPQLQRSQQLVTANHLPQINAASHNSTQQLNTQLMNGASQLRLQMIQQRQQQQQQMSRKMILPGSMGGLGMGVGNISGVNSMSGVGGAQGGLANMVGLSGMNSVVGMAGMNSISASMGGISSLANIGQLSNIGGMGQTSGMGNMMGQQLRPGSINPAQAAAVAAAANKARMAQGRGRPGTMGNTSNRNTIENMSGISASNQVHNSIGLAILGQPMNRGNMSSLQRAAGSGMGPPKHGTSGMNGVPGQNFYLNQQQQINSQQQQQLNSQLQLTSQQLSMPQPPSSQQPLSSQPSLNVQQQLNQQQQISSQQQLNSQSQMNPQQQLNPQQLSSQQQLNPQQMSVGNLGSLVGGPPSPQLSSQTLGSVGSITSSPMELQSANRGSSMTTGP